ncbi:MFS transporter [bacterium]|nr:MFS transporter [bacterium]
MIKSTRMPQTNRKISATKLVLLLCSSMTVMAGATIAPALPLIESYFENTANVEMLTRFVFTIPALFIVLFGPVVGFLTDRYGRKSVLASSLLLYGISGSAGLYLDSMTSLLVSRALLGVAVAGVLTCTTTLIADYFYGREREAFMGKQAAFMGLGGIVFLLAGGALATLSWRGPFAVYLSAILVLPMVLLWIYEPDRKAITAENQEQSTQTIPWKNINALYLLAITGMVLFYLIPVQLPFYLKEIADSTPPQIGMAIAWFTMCSAVASVLYPKIRRKLSYSAIYFLLFILIGIGYMSLGLINDYQSALGTLILSGLGFGLFMPNINIMLTKLAPEHVRGRIVGGLTTCLFLGQFISPIAAQPFISHTGLGGMFGAYTSAAIFSLLLALIFLIPKNPFSFDSASR